jgi:hypothetical protein
MIKNISRSVMKGEYYTGFDPVCIVFFLYCSSGTAGYSYPDIVFASEGISPDVETGVDVFVGAVQSECF